MPLTIPTISLTPLLCSPTPPPSLISAVRSAAISPGFFQITHHGLSPTQTARFFSHLHSFFALPQSAKDSLAQNLAVSFRGYERLGVQELKAGVRDVKEGFVWGREEGGEEEGLMVRGPNKWPAQMGEEFREEMMRFFEDTERIGRMVLRVLAMGLGVDGEYFEGLMEGGNVCMTCRAHRYLRGEEGRGEGGKSGGISPHTDFGVLTLLLQDDVGGLEVFDREERTWYPVEPVEGAMVVNLGDIMARWTNDRYMSTLHRVNSPVGERDRYSVALFMVGSVDYVVECLPSCLEEGEEPNYAPITVGEHIMNRVHEAYLTA